MHHLGYGGTAAAANNKATHKEKLYNTHSVQHLSNIKE